MLYFLALIYISALYIRPGEIVPALAGVPVIDYLSMATGVFAGLALLLKPRNFLDQPQDKSLLVYWIAIIISNPAWGWIGGGEEAFLQFLPIVFCYFLIRIAIRNYQQLRGLMTLLIVLNVFLAFNGLLQVFAGTGIGGANALQTKEGIRIQGTGIFNDPNDLGLTLVMTVPFVISAFISRPARFVSRVLAPPALTVLLVACYYTNSRGTILGLAAVFAVYAYRRFGSISATMITTAFLTALIMLAPSRMATVSAEDPSAQGRVQAWAAAYGMFFQSPLTGVGYGQFSSHHERVAHNGFLHVLGELGLLGAIAFVSLFYWHFIKLRAPVSGVDSPENRVSARIRHDLADSCIGLLVCMFFLSRQYIVVSFIIVAMGACYSSVAGNKDQKSGSTIMSLAAIVGLTFAVMAVLYVVVRILSIY